MSLGLAISIFVTCAFMLVLAQIQPVPEETMSYSKQRAASLEEEAADAQRYADSLHKRAWNYYDSMKNVKATDEMLKTLSAMKRDARQAQADADNLARRAAGARYAEQLSAEQL